MSRRTLRQWRDQITVLPAPRARTPRPKREPGLQLRNWLVTIPYSDREHVVKTVARTRSEARGIVKERLGLDRLPPGTRVEPIGGAAAAV